MNQVIAPSATIGRQIDLSATHAIGCTAVGRALSALCRPREGEASDEVHERGERRGKEGDGVVDKPRQAVHARGGGHCPPHQAKYHAHHEHVPPQPPKHAASDRRDRARCGVRPIARSFRTRLAQPQHDVRQRVEEERLHSRQDVEWARMIRQQGAYDRHAESDVVTLCAEDGKEGTALQTTPSS